MESLDPTISETAISESVSNANSIMPDPPQMDESNTKFKIIQPFLQDILDYELEDMELEYKVQMGGQPILFRSPSAAE